MGAIETRIYSGMLYALADEIDSEEGCVTESSETVREAAERLDVQTITINCLKDQRDALLDFAKWVAALKTGGLIEGKAKAAIAAVEAKGGAV